MSVERHQEEMLRAAEFIKAGGLVLMGRRAGKSTLWPQLARFCYWAIGVKP